MAPAESSRVQDANQPLADYFWIAGIDSQQIADACKPTRWSYEANEGLNGFAENTTDIVIPEDVTAERDNQSSKVGSPKSPSSTKKRNSYQRLSQLSDDARNSIQMSVGARSSESNRSSLTIRASPTPVPRISSIISDADFEDAMKRFTVDRDAFFLDLNFSTPPTDKPSRSKARPKTQKIVVEDIDTIPSRTFGSVRRHLSFKDMTSMRRQPSMARRISTRASRRVSNYNSVIPVPETLHSSSDQHPLKRKFEPVLLDKYPGPSSAHETKKRSTFPDYVPMFAFPNDIRIVSSDTRPRSTWHEFSMTGADNSRIFATCLILWIPMTRQDADELEKRCEEWRRANLSDAEREMAASLAERLALERAKLSQLLSQLPQAPSGSAAREDLEDEIQAVEEKINVMSDMLKPLRHGAASKIQGLTDGDTGLWIPRAYGLLGRESTLTTFWRQWLRAISVPMMDGSILRVPPSSPKVGMWQPLERYIFTLCSEAPSPISSKTQVDIAIRGLHLYAKKPAINELPGSRSTDLYPLFRALSIPNVILLMEYVLAESRIILLSSHTSMLQLVCRAITELIWPLQWTGIYIPVLPSRLILALEAPCPYICGIEKRYDKYELPDDDFVLVDLDKNELQSTGHPPSIPRQQRRKLMSLLQLAAPHNHSCGVPLGPPPYAVETFPFDAFAAESETPFTGITKSTNIDKLVSLSSTMFGAQAAADTIRRAPVLNAFLTGRPTRGKSMDRPRTAASSVQMSIHHDTDQFSPVTASFPPLPVTPVSRNDSGYALQTSLREKRSGHFDSLSKRNGSISGLVRRKHSLPFIKHSSSHSAVSMSPEMLRGTSTYAPSTYAQSTLAASTIMPGVSVNPAKNTETTSWVEGHCLQWRPSDGPSTCGLCDEKAQDGYHRCVGCGLVVHGYCADQVTIVCPSAFYPDQIRAAFVRFFASLFYTYRKFMSPPLPQSRQAGATYYFNFEAFARSQTPENSAYMQILRQTQAFNEFIAEREQPTLASNPSIALFDAIILAKRNRSGRLRSGIPNMTMNMMPFSSRSPLSNGSTSILGDTSTHQWRLISIPSSNERPDLGPAAKGRDYHTIVSRTPAKIEEGLIRQSEEMPKLPTMKMNGKPRRSILKERMNGLGMNAP